MKYRKFGKSNLAVSEIGMGCWGIGGNSYGKTFDDVSIETINLAHELGCNFFDTADCYGNCKSEELLGQTLNNFREEVIICTKVGTDFYSHPTKFNFNSDYIKFALERSLDRLKSYYVDIYLLHNPPIEILNDDSIWNLLNQFKEENKIRYIGVSIFDPSEGIKYIQNQKVDCIEVVYNIYYQKPIYELFPLAKKENIAIIAREPLGNGFLTGKYDDNYFFNKDDKRSNCTDNFIQSRTALNKKLKQIMDGNESLTQLALQFALSSDAVSVTIPGAKYPQQIQENITSSDLPILDEEKIREINKIRYNS